MARDNIPLVAFNRGLISKFALARTDIKRTALSAEVETNWMPRVLGSMMLRPGLKYVNSTDGDKLAATIPFIYATDDTALMEFTDLSMRVLINDVPISRVAVSTAISNGDFSSGTNWTDDDESGAVSTISGGILSLVGTGNTRAIRTQTVTVSAGDQPKEHALRIVVLTGPVTLRVGTTNGGDELVGETTLGAGTHSIAFTPGVGTIYVRFMASRKYAAKVDSCTIEAAGIMEVPAPWVEDDVFSMRWDQSADVVYIGCDGYKQRKIERRGTGRSWSVVEYAPEDGPFRNLNADTALTLTPSANEGDITLTASRAIFKPSHVGALYKIESIGQQVAAVATGGNQFTAPIRVIGITSGLQRTFFIDTTGTWVGTLTLQRSVTDPGNWVDVQDFTTNLTNHNYQDPNDNQVVYYRIGFKSGNYSSGTANLSIRYSNGSITGVARVTAFTNETTVSAIVLKALGSTSASENWYESEWSDRRGYPIAPALHEGRLFWVGSTKVIGSVSDAFESFDSETEGDSAPINRSIGRGPVDDVQWVLPLQRLCFGTAGSEWVARSSSFDEILTKDNFNLKDPSSQGSANVNAIKIDAKGFFVGKSGNKLFQMVYADDTGFDYQSVDMMELCPDVGKPSLTRISAQRQPDTRVHCVRGDGKTAILISQPSEEVLCWIMVETLGIVEDVYVLPGPIEDVVYYTVARTIGGVTKRYRERFAMEDDCQGGTLNMQADSFITYTGAATATITGLGHLEGEEVIVWADGKDFSPGWGDNQTTFTVTGGQITLPSAVSNAVVGLPYGAPFRSTKLAYAAAYSTALTQKKRMDHLGLIMANVHYQGLKYGKTLDIDAMDNLPLVMNDKPVPPDTVFEDLDTTMFEFPGDWDTDSRLCLYAQAPRPVTLLAAIVGMKTNDKT